MYQDFFNKNDDYLNEFKQKVANQKIATLEEHRSELARSRNNFLGTFAGVALAGIVGWLVLAPQYAATNKEIPVIRRPATAVKVKPENRGGMEIPNQDKDVYNLVEKKKVEEPVVENLLPLPETPKLPDIVPEVEEVNPDSNNLDEIIDAVDTVEQSATDKTDSPVIPSKPSDLLADNPEKTTESIINEKEKVEVSEPKVEVKSEPKVEEAEKKTPPVSVATPAKIATDRQWQIQLIASQNKAAVEKLWGDLSAKYSALKGLSHEVQVTDLGAQGLFYRLRAGTFASKAEAADFCANLKKQGMKDCITKER